MAWPPPAMAATMMGAWNAEEQDDLLHTFETRAHEVLTDLESAGLSSQLTSDERQFFSTGFLERTEQQWVDSAWAVESVACCLWALELMPDLAAYDTQYAGDILKLVPSSSEPEMLRVRPRVALEGARATAELWHWRSRTRQLLESGTSLPPMREGLSLDDIVRMTAAEACKAGDVSTTIDEDFPANGKAYRDLSTDEYASVASIALERHRALNWICGRAPGNRWDETPTDT